MLSFELTPGKAQPAPEAWPCGAELPRAADRPTLLTFIHPHCACSRASLAELAVLLARCRREVAVVIVFVQPPGLDVKWEETGLWQAAAEIPGVERFCDRNARVAAAFRASTSGETLLYSSEGTLMFHGGITPSRASRGDNAGRAALEQLIAGFSPGVRATPVFGCGLCGRDDITPTKQPVVAK